MRSETYILRIYRRKRDPRLQIAGRVETPAGDLGASFVSLAELSEILETPKAHMQRSEPPEHPNAAFIKVYRQE